MFQNKAATRDSLARANETNEIEFENDLIFQRRRNLFCAKVEIDPTCRNLIIRLWSDSAHDQLRVRRVLAQSLEQLGEQNGRAVVGHRHSKAFTALRRNQFLIAYDRVQTPH